MRISILSVSATQIKNSFGAYLEKAMSEPVSIVKSSSKRKVAVILSINEYERLMALENAYWAQRAKKAAMDES